MFASEAGLDIPKSSCVGEIVEEGHEHAAKRHTDDRSGQRVDRYEWGDEADEGSTPRMNWDLPM